MEFKTVKNPARPGRAPGGHEWVRDENNNIITNDKGEYAYQPATGAKKKAKTPAKTKAAKGKRAAKKTATAKKKTAAKKKPAAKKAGRKAAPDMTGEMKSALLLKKTYKDLTSEELVKIRDITSGLIDKAKEAEVSVIEKQIAKLQGKLNKLS